MKPELVLARAGSSAITYAKGKPPASHAPGHPSPRVHAILSPSPRSPQAWILGNGGCRPHSLSGS